MQFRISYYEEEGGFIYFDAKDQAEAEELFNQLNSGEIYEDELPNFTKKSKNGQNEFLHLEEVK